jgi:hypothetical protein
MQFLMGLFENKNGNSIFIGICIEVAATTITFSVKIFSE